MALFHSSTKMAMHPDLLLLLLTKFLFLQSTFAVQFFYNGFNHSDLSLFDTATLNSHAISLTQNTTFSIGRALHHSKIPTRSPNSTHLLPFSTSFTLSITPYKNHLPGHGLAFVFFPSTGIEGPTAAQHLGFTNKFNDGDPNNHVFGVEFDVFQNQLFNDINDNHVGVNVNSLTSLIAHKAGYWANGNGRKLLKEEKLNNGVTYRVWIEYLNSQLSVTMAAASMKKPRRPSF